MANLAGYGAAPPEARSRASTRYASALAAAAVFGVLLFCLFGRLMDFGIRRDEMLFVAPAELIGTWALYKDYFYNHVPYTAWLFQGAHAVVGDLGLLFSARLVVFGGWLLLLGAMAWGVWHISGSMLLAAVSALFLITNDTLLAQAGMAASNNLLPLAVATLAIGLFLGETVRGRARPGRMFAVGLLLAVAVGMKVSAAAFVVPIALAMLFVPARLGVLSRLRHAVVPMALGGIIGGAPLFFLLSQMPDVFVAHVVGFHTGPHVAYWQALAETEPQLALSLAGKLKLAYANWLAGSALLLWVIALAGLALLWRATGRVTAGGLGVVAALLAAAAAMSFLPTPGFDQYYALPLIVMPFAAAVLVRQLGEAERASLAPMLGAAALLMLALGAPRLAPGGVTMATNQPTEVQRFVAGGAALREVMAAEGLAEGKVATLMPLYPLEAGLAVYPELATGQFAYRIAPFIEPELARHYVLAGSEAMIARFEAEPPAALLLGYEPALEAPLRQWAIEAGYVPRDVPFLNNRYGRGEVFLPPEAANR